MGIRCTMRSEKKKKILIALGSRANPMNLVVMKSKCEAYTQHNGAPFVEASATSDIDTVKLRYYATLWDREKVA